MRVLCSAFTMLLLSHFMLAQVTTDSVPVVLRSQPNDMTNGPIIALLGSSPLSTQDPDLKKTIGENDLKASDSSPSTFPLEKNRVYIVHVVHWNLVPSVNIISSRWYLYKYVPGAPGAGTFHRIGPDDIYQKDRATFIALEYGIGDSKPATGTLPTLTYSISVAKKTPTNVAAVSSVLGAIFGVSPARALVLPKPAVINAPIVMAQSLTDEISSTGTPLPFAWSFTMTATGSTVGANGDCTNLTTTAKCTLSQSFATNDAEYWNIGVNIIPYGPRENRYYQSGSGTVSQIHTLHSPLYAVADLDVFAHYWSMTKGPYIQAGVPLSGAVFHLPYVGIALPVPRSNKLFPVSFSVYAGVGFMKQTFPKGLAIGQTATAAIFDSSLKTDRAVKGLFGIEVPVGGIVSKIKGVAYK